MLSNRSTSNELCCICAYYDSVLQYAHLQHSLFHKKKDAKIAKTVPREHHAAADIAQPELVNTDVCVNGGDNPDKRGRHMTEVELAEIEARQFVDGIKHPSQTKDDIRRLLDEVRRLQSEQKPVDAIGFPLPPEPSQPT